MRYDALLQEHLRSKGSLGNMLLGPPLRAVVVLGDTCMWQEMLRCFQGGLCQLRASHAPTALMGGSLGFPVFFLFKEWAPSDSVLA